MINRTKTSILSLAAAALCAFSMPFQTQAQELTYSDRFYISVSGGVAFGVTNGDQGGNFVGSATPENLLSNNRGTLGSGVPLNLRLGMFVTDQISLDLGVQYFSGFRQDVQMIDLPPYSRPLMHRRLQSSSVLTLP
ncbi:hypothetical protein A3SI_19746 [Nitritalea halalkaliphila LW7]|uniref:Outer membrane protein beta-barrel domain-containing protein n=1 Tax=Nitritalea halalkaliphila LW7 TaxID=1189621 RepID=I5BS78_9BACT|nr:hypothetical protein [Nitritalea halalkaliphila]EIM72430.1 hypothetical protein A3SI_19746 [Nitritalea halalkaliphila LW7]